MAFRALLEPTGLRAGLLSSVFLPAIDPGTVAGLLENATGSRLTANGAIGSANCLSPSSSRPGMAGTACRSRWVVRSAASVVSYMCARPSQHAGRVAGWRPNSKKPGTVPGTVSRSRR